MVAWNITRWLFKRYIGFQRRCTERLEKLGNAAMDSQRYNEAVEHYSTILSLDSVDHVEILLKRSKARALMNLWEEALNDTDEVSFLLLIAGQLDEKVCRLSSLIRHLIKATSGGMRHYTGRDAIRKPLRHSI